MGKDSTIDYRNGNGYPYLSNPKPFITFEEFSKHNSREDQWILINGKVYDVTNFAKRHPGGAKILNHFAGEDATVCIHFLLIICVMANEKYR